MSVYGINLGTTDSCIAKLDHKGDPVIIQDERYASDKLASAIYYLEDGEMIIGEAAVDSGIEDPSRLCRFFMRYIGRYDLDPEERDESERYIIDGNPKDPVELTAAVLKTIAEYARSAGEEVRVVVLACPVYFNSDQKIAEKIAAEQIGLNVLGFISEPVAVVLSYAHSCRTINNGMILVFDLGGTALSVTLIEATEENGTCKYEILAYESDESLGGVDWDERVRDLLIEKLCDETGCWAEDIPEEVMWEIRVEAKRTKQRLTSRTEVKTRINFDGMVIRTVITRDEFDARCEDLLDKTCMLTEAVIRDAGLEKDEIDAVLLSGGSSNMVMVREMLKREFGEEKIIYFKPELAAAKGAALAEQLTDM